VRRKVRAGQRVEAHAVPAGRDPRRHHPGQHQRAPRKRVQRQLHRRVFALRPRVLARGIVRHRSPNRDQEILRNNRNFVEHKQQKQIEAEKHSVHAADQHQIKRKKLLRAPLDIPRKQNSRRRRDPRQQHQRQADPVRRQVIRKPELRNPSVVRNEKKLARLPVPQRRQPNAQPHECR
jgi:hypothetical protein